HCGSQDLHADPLAQVRRTRLHSEGPRGPRRAAVGQSLRAGDESCQGRGILRTSEGRVAAERQRRGDLTGDRSSLLGEVGGHFRRPFSADAKVGKGSTSDVATTGLRRLFPNESTSSSTFLCYGLHALAQVARHISRCSWRLLSSPTRRTTICARSFAFNAGMQGCSALSARAAWSYRCPRVRLFDRSYPRRAADKNPSSSAFHVLDWSGKAKRLEKNITQDITEASCYNEPNPFALPERCVTVRSGAARRGITPEIARTAMDKRR